MRHDFYHAGFIFSVCDFGSRDANLLADEWESPVGATEELDGYLSDVVCVFWGVGRMRGWRGDRRGNFNCC